MTDAFTERAGVAWLCVALCGLVCISAGAGEVELSLGKSPQTLVVENPGPAVTPALYIVGRPDRSTKPPRKTKGITLNGVRLTESLLSESVLILRPDGSGSWGYHAGFDIFREPHFRNGRRIDPRTLVEYDKWRYDPLGPVARVGGDMNLLRLYHNRPMPAALYEIAFPPPIRIRRLEVRSNCDSLAVKGVVVRVRLYADRRCGKLIADRPVGPAAESKRFPVRFDGLDRHRVYLELSARGPPGVAVDLYWPFFEAILDTRGLPLPVLRTGKNVWQVGQDADASRRGRIVVRWEDRPPPQRVWDDFEDPSTSRWHGGKVLTGGPETGLAFTGRKFIRATFPAIGKDYALSRSCEALDLTRYNRLGVAARVRRGAPMRAILLGIRNAAQRHQYVRLRPGPRWKFQVFDIGRFRRDRVRQMMIYWVGMPGINRPGSPCVYDFDTIALWHEAPSPPPRADLPGHVRTHRSAVAEADPPRRAIPPVQEWFPRGVYDGICSRSDRECRWLFDRMKTLHMNTVYLSNGTLEGLRRILPLAEARGIRLVYQGGGEASLYYLHLATPQARRQSLAKVVLPRARQWLPRFRGRWGLVAWSLTEEIAPQLSRELQPLYRLVRALDPDHPPTVLHNNLSAAIADLETNRPAVITHDFYPYFWSPRSGPSNPRRSVSAYRSHVASYYKACRKHGASLWMMPQAWGQAETAPLDPPNYGYRRGMRTPQPGEIKLQGWVAVAEGATGLLYYAALAADARQHQLWDAGWRETENTRAAGQLFERIGRVGSLLCRLQRDYREAGFVRSSNPSVLAHSFVPRPGRRGKGRYIVLASLDGFGGQQLDLTVPAEARVYDLVARKDLTGALKSLRLGPGEGTLLLVGTEGDYRAACRLR